MNTVGTRMMIGLLLSFIAMPVYSADLEKERATILEIDRQWSAAASEGRNVDFIVSFWAEDATLFPPGMPAIVGKEAIREFVQQSYAMPGFRIQWVTEQVVVSSDGSMAYGTGTNQTTYDDPQGKKILIHGKAVTVWKKDSSGVWKCVIDMWNDAATLNRK